jgi:NHL repeat
MKSIFLPVMLLLLIVTKASGQGNIVTIAGDGVTQYIGDGWPATNYSLAAPAGVCTDNNGNVFVADYADSRLRRIDKHDTLFTIGDTSGVPGYSGDGGIAMECA